MRRYLCKNNCMWDIFLEFSRGYIFRADRIGGVTTVPMTVCLPVCHKCIDPLIMRPGTEGVVGLTQMFYMVLLLRIRVYVLYNTELCGHRIQGKHRY